MEQFYLNQWKYTGKRISDTGFPSLPPPFLCCSSKAPLPGIQVRCCHVLQAESGLSYLSLPWAEVKNVTQKGNVRLAASRSCPSEQLLGSADTYHKRGGEDVAKNKYIEASVQWYPGTLGSTQHGTKDQPKYRMRKKKESQRTRGNHCFIINVSYNLSQLQNVFRE